MLESLYDLHSILYDCCWIFKLSAMCYVDVVVRTSLYTITSGVDGDDVDHPSVHLLLLITR